MKVDLERIYHNLLAAKYETVTHKNLMAVFNHLNVMSDVTRANYVKHMVKRGWIREVGIGLRTGIVYEIVKQEDK